MNYGISGYFITSKEDRCKLAAILSKAGGFLEGSNGNVVYSVYFGEEDDRVYVYEVWESGEAHEASLQLATVRDLITEARPLIKGMSEQQKFRVLKKEAQV